MDFRPVPSYTASTGIYLSLSPRVGSQSWSASGTWFLFLDRRKRGTVFSSVAFLPTVLCRGTRRNAILLFNVRYIYNSTFVRILQSFSLPGGSAPCIPRAEAQVLRRGDKEV